MNEKARKVLSVYAEPFALETHGARGEQHMRSVLRAVAEDLYDVVATVYRPSDEVFQLRYTLRKLLSVIDEAPMTGDLRKVLEGGD